MGFNHYCLQLSLVFRKLRERVNPLTPISDQDRISPYNIKQKSDENKEKFQLGDYKLIQYQILQTNITRTVWQTIRRITNEILEVKGLMY